MSTTNPKTSIAQLFLQAIRGDVKDFTSSTISINKAIFLLAVPMVVEMLLESSFAIVDIYFVNKVGKGAASVVGLTESALTILYSIAWGLAMGATALVARRSGEKDYGAASKIAGQAIIVASIISILISVVGLIFPKQILLWMGADINIANNNFRYTQLMLGSNIVIMLLFVNNGIFRGAGDASIAMRALIIANIINIVLDPFLIMGYGPFPKMGVMGAAVATTIGRSIGVLYQLWHLFKGKDLIKLTIKHLRPSIELIISLFKSSSGVMLQFLIGSGSWIFLAKMVATSGTDVTDGYITAIRICIFTLLPAWGIANAAATLVGQNLGAKQPQRAEQSVWRSALLAFCFFVIVAIIFYFFGENLVSFFTQNPIAIEQGTLCLHILALGYIFFAYGMVLCQSFNGAGDSFTPTIINLVCCWAIQIPLAWYFANKLNMGPKGVYIVISICEALIAVISILIFRMGRWKKVKI